MRFSSIVGIGVVVLLVAAVAMVAFRGNKAMVEEPAEMDEIVVDEVADSGQFFQAIPSEEEDLSVNQDEGVEEIIGAETVTITMSETGFSPASVKITAGTEIVFVNNGQAAHWPASDSHPTHTILPEFDAKRGLGTGESYAHIFTKVGVWRCHDHLMPNLTCEIVVQ